jgi:small subunit ribosomal protein S7
MSFSTKSVFNVVSKKEKPKINVMMPNDVFKSYTSIAENESLFDIKVRSSQLKLNEQSKTFSKNKFLLEHSKTNFAYKVVAKHCFATLVHNKNLESNSLNKSWINKFQYNPENKLLSLNKSTCFLSDKFINLLMIDGKKSLACKIFFQTLNIIRIKSSLNLPAINIIFQAIENVKPYIEVRKVRIAGKTYQVPAIIAKNKQQTLAIRWIIECARKRKKVSKQSFSQCLANELLESFKKQGQARQKRDELHKIAESNRAYVRYRWW